MFALFGIFVAVCVSLPFSHGLFCKRKKKEVLENTAYLKNNLA